MHSYDISRRSSASSTFYRSRMRMSREIPLPTEAELRLLRGLWGPGASTGREVLERLPESEQGGYTTVLKLLQIMHGKGLVVRDETNRSHVYAAAVPPETT